jgi:hypothetical protein
LGQVVIRNYYIISQIFFSLLFLYLNYIILIYNHKPLFFKYLHLIQLDLLYYNNQQIFELFYNVNILFHHLINVSICFILINQIIHD